MNFSIIIICLGLWDLQPGTTAPDPLALYLVHWQQLTDSLCISVKRKQKSSVKLKIYLTYFLNHLRIWETESVFSQ